VARVVSPPSRRHLATPAGRRSSRRPPRRSWCRRSSSGCATNEDEDDASTIDAATASIKAFFPYLMVPQDAVEKVEGFLISSIKQLAADRVIG